MAKAGQRKCMSCGEFFIPDHRKGERQRYCCAAQCRRASKAASQAAWLARAPNNDYFSGPVHVARVQAWRAAHPGYSRGRARPSRALQELLTPQVPDAIEESANRAELPEAPAVVALQDLLNAESPLLAGLIAHLFQPALQDDCVFRTIVTGRFGIVTADFGNVTGHFGDVTDAVSAPAQVAVVDLSRGSVLVLRMNNRWGIALRVDADRKLTPL